MEKESNRGNNRQEGQNWQEGQNRREEQNRQEGQNQREEQNWQEGQNQREEQNRQEGQNRQEEQNQREEQNWQEGQNQREEQNWQEGQTQREEQNRQEEQNGQEKQNQQTGTVPPPPTSGYGTWPIYLNGKPIFPAPGSSPYPVQGRQKKLNVYEERLKADFGRYGFCALFIGILAAFCFYRNPNAITYPLFIGAVYLAAYRILPSLGFPVKKESFFLAAAALVLAINSAVTASPVLHYLNNIAQLLLGSIFLIHQAYSDKYWDIEKYFSSIVLLWFEALASLPQPFSYTMGLMKKVKRGRSRNVLMILGGCAAGIPAVIYLGYLLADADAVFKMVIENFILNFLDLPTLFTIACMIVFSALTACCLMGSVCSMSLPEVKERKRHNPLAAISFTAMISLLYLVFCGIQVIYLFAGKGTLPEDMTYSEYARQGFFQLLAVAVLNLIFVLNCFKYFHQHHVLTFLLTVISLCTYVMIASAVYRMLLYVGAYYLTFLRLFVLWFLGVLAVLMMGVLASIFLPHFPLFRWCLTVVTLAYCGFAWCLPDYQIARYNIAQEGGWITLNNVEYFIDELSADAALVLAEAPLSPDVTYNKLYFYKDSPEYEIPVDKVILISSLDGIPWYFSSMSSSRITSLEEQVKRNLEVARNWKPGIRSYNFSEARAKKMVDFVDGK